MKYDYLIVGAGFAGSVLAERISTQLDKKVLVVDKRSHIGGNCFDYYDDYGVLCHKYGPHAFHTKNQKVWEYINQFSSFNTYNHHVLAKIEGKLVPIPFNINTIYQLFPESYASKLESLLIENYGYGLKIPILKLRETQNSELKFLADYIYKNVFEGYNLKQWGKKTEDIDPAVSSRVPVYISRDNRYFQDKFQGIPSGGYTNLFQKLLNHKNIHILLNADYKEIESDIKYDKIIYTGPIDYFFDFAHGRLPYRSLQFEFENKQTEYIQPVAQVNYPNDDLFTRITEFKHFLGQQHNSTTFAREYSLEYVFGKNDPYYPISNDDNQKIYDKYLMDAAKLKNAIFCGRLADYKYYNMDEVIGVALMIFEKKIAGTK